MDDERKGLSTRRSRGAPGPIAKVLAESERRSTDKFPGWPDAPILDPETIVRIRAYLAAEGWTLAGAIGEAETWAKARSFVCVSVTDRIWFSDAVSTVAVASLTQLKILTTAP